MTDNRPGGAEKPQPRMTLRVYTVDRYGTVTRTGPEVTVVATDKLPPLRSPSWPPCRCERCRR
jgi:hypothetical protein